MILRVSLAKELILNIVFFVNTLSVSTYIFLWVYYFKWIKNIHTSRFSKILNNLIFLLQTTKLILKTFFLLSIGFSPIARCAHCQCESQVRFWHFNEHTKCKIERKKCRKNRNAFDRCCHSLPTISNKWARVMWETPNWVLSSSRTPVRGQKLQWKGETTVLYMILSPMIEYRGLPDIEMILNHFWVLFLRSWLLVI